MKIYSSVDAIRPKLDRPLVTLGNFDGVHRGHESVIRQVLERSRRSGRPALLVTFNPHPLKVVRPESAPPLLQTHEEKMARIEALGVEIGSVYFKAVGLGPGPTPRFHFKQPHHGDALSWLGRFEKVAAARQMPPTEEKKERAEPLEKAGSSADIRTAVRRAGATIIEERCDGGTGRCSSTLR